MLFIRICWKWRQQKAEFHCITWSKRRTEWKPAVSWRCRGWLQKRVFWWHSGGDPRSLHTNTARWVTPAARDRSHAEFLTFWVSLVCVQPPVGYFWYFYEGKLSQTVFPCSLAPLLASPKVTSRIRGIFLHGLCRSSRGAGGPKRPNSTHFQTLKMGTVRIFSLQAVEILNYLGLLFRV